MDIASAKTRRSIFQVQEGDDEDIKAALGIENVPSETATPRALIPMKFPQAHPEGVPRESSNPISLTTL